ncbi:MAG: hypothetical protein SFT68_00125, partial [Rickettsiaceae bacterium]|nr:hypothetical protein [Rickettsiaceae bacterium]
MKKNKSIFGILILACIFMLLSFNSISYAQKTNKISTLDTSEDPEMELWNIIFESTTDEGNRYKIFAKKAIKSENNEYLMSNILASIVFSGSIL